MLYCNAAIICFFNRKPSNNEKIICIDNSFTIIDYGFIVVGNGFVGDAQSIFVNDKARTAFDYSKITINNAVSLKLVTSI